MSYFLIFSFVLLVLVYDFFSVHLHISFLDELFVGILFIYALLIRIKHKITLTTTDKKIFIAFIILVLLGLIGGLLSGIQTISIQLMDFIIFIKFFITYFSTRIILTHKNIEYVLTQQIITFLLASVTFVILILLWNEVFRFYPHYDIKIFNLASEQLFFGHPAKYAFFFEIILILLLPLLKNNNFIIILFIIIFLAGFLSLRTKFIVFTGLLGIFIIALKFFNLKKLSVKKIFLGSFFFLAFIMIFAYDDIIFHLLKGSNGSYGVRGLLLISAYDIASNSFPLGSGFGSFGSFASVVNYSSLYYTYGFDLIDGCMPDKPSFLVDNFYAMVLGEFGFIGFILFVYILILLIKIFIHAFNMDSINRYYYISLIVLIITLSLDSLSDTPFSQNRGMFMAIYIAIIYNKFLINQAKHEK